MSDLPVAENDRNKMKGTGSQIRWEKSPQRNPKDTQFWKKVNKMITDKIIDYKNDYKEMNEV